MKTLSYFYLPVFSARVAMFIVYFWFGILKVFNLSPANPLVKDLLEQTLPFMSFETFILMLGVYEMIIGIMYLIPKLELPSIVLTALHLATTFMPLILLPQVSWQSFLIPTIEGQYIIKNVLIIALSIHIYTSTRSKSVQTN